MRIMITHINNHDVCEKGCCLLKDIMLDNSNQIHVISQRNNRINIDTIKTKACNLGVIDVVLEVMNKNNNDIDLCINACSALRNIAYNNGIFFPPL